MTSIQTLTIVRNVDSKMPSRKTKRTRYYDALLALKIGDGFKVSILEYSNAIMACRYGINKKKQFSGWQVASIRISENEYIIKRIK